MTGFVEGKKGETLGAKDRRGYGNVWRMGREEEGAQHRLKCVFLVETKVDLLKKQNESLLSHCWVAAN